MDHVHSPTPPVSLLSNILATSNSLEGRQTCATQVDGSHSSHFP